MNTPTQEELKRAEELAEAYYFKTQCGSHAIKYNDGIEAIAQALADQRQELSKAVAVDEDCDFAHVYCPDQKQFTETVQQYLKKGGWRVVCVEISSPDSWHNAWLVRRIKSNINTDPDRVSVSREMLENCKYYVELVVEEYREDEIEGCSCHLSPPCSACLSGSERFQLADQTLASIESVLKEGKR
jgi:hypothetical protein